MKLKNSNCDKTQIVMKLKNSNCDETQELKFYKTQLKLQRNLKTQIGMNLK